MILEHACCDISIAACEHLSLHIAVGWQSQLIADIYNPRFPWNVLLSNTGTATTQVNVPVKKAAILDTGTNILLVPKFSVLDPLEKAMCADSSLYQCNALYAGKCMPLTDAQLAAYPPIALQLSSVRCSFLCQKSCTRGRWLRFTPIADLTHSRHTCNSTPHLLCASSSDRVLP